MARPSELLGRLAARLVMMWQERSAGSAPSIAPVPEVHIAPLIAQPLDVFAVQRWCQTTGSRIDFSLRGDRYQITGAGLGLIDGRSIPVSPWLALAPVGSEQGRPAIRLEHLGTLTESAGASEACFSVNGGTPVAWQGIADAIAAVAGLVQGDVDLLKALGVLAPEQIEEAVVHLRPDETIDAALFRLGSVPLTGWVDSLVGRPRLPGPSARPFDDRLGMRLLAVRAVTQGQLKQALATQAEPDVRPIGQILAVQPAAIARAAAAQRPVHVQLAEADTLGETLIRWGFVRRTDWLATQRAGGDVAGRLVKAGKLTQLQLARAQAYRHHLMQLQTARQVRIGEILVEGGLDRAVLGKVLAWQVDQPLPVAELMAVHRLLTPVAAARALGRQADRYRQLAEASLPAPEPSAPLEVAPPARARTPLVTRRALAATAIGVICLAYAISYGARVHGADYGWFDALFPRPLTTALIYQGNLQAIRQVSHGQEATGPITVLPMSPLTLPGQGPSGTLGSWHGRPGAVPTMASPRVRGGTVASARSLGTLGSVALPSTNGVNGTIGSTGLWHPEPPPAGPAGAATIGQGRALGQNGAGRRLKGSFIAHRPAGRSNSPTMGSPGGLIPGFTSPGSLRSPSTTPLPAIPSGNAQAIPAGPRSPQIQTPSYGRQRRHLAASVHQSEAVFRAELGEAYFASGDLAEAAAEFSGAAHDDPTLALPYYFLAQIADRSGQPAKALVEYRRYLALAPQGEFAAQASGRLQGTGP